MAIGTMESILIGAAILLGVVIFGRGFIKKGAEMIFGAKTDIEEVKAKFEKKEKLESN